MKTKITLGLLALICFLSLSATSQTKPAQWEYKFQYQCDEKKANNLAAEGWELVNMGYAAFGSTGTMACAFRRPK